MSNLLKFDFQIFPISHIILWVFLTLINDQVERCPNYQRATIVAEKIVIYTDKKPCQQIPQDIITSGLFTHMTHCRLPFARWHDLFVPSDNTPYQLPGTTTRTSPIGIQNISQHVRIHYLRYVSVTWFDSMFFNFQRLESLDRQRNLFCTSRSMMRHL